MTTATLHAPTLAGKRLDRHFHVCALFRSREEEYRTLLPFFAEGLAAGEKAIHIIDPARRRDHLERLASTVDVTTRTRLGQLEVIDWTDAYLKSGGFDSETMLALVREVIATARVQGFPRARFMGHMEWTTLDVPGIDRLLEYEAFVDDVLDGTGQPAVCSYDIARYDARSIIDVLRAHRLVIVDGVLRENPFHVPAAQLLGRSCA
jgi:hypothetical protein